MISKTYIDGMPHSLKTRKNVLTLMWQHCGIREIVALKALRPAEFDTPYAYCLEEVTYLRRLHPLFRACEAIEISDVERVP